MGGHAEAYKHMNIMLLFKYSLFLKLCFSNLFHPEIALPPKQVYNILQTKSLEVPLSEYLRKPKGDCDFWLWG